MATSSAGPSESVYTFLVILLLIVGLRLRRVVYGTKVSVARTIGYSIFYAVFGSFFTLSSFLLGVQPIYSLGYALLASALAFWSYRFADKRISFWRGKDGSVYYKGGIIIYLIYLVGLVARIAVDFLLIGPSAFTFSFNSSTTPNEILGFTVTDFILMFGVGLLIGRNARVYKRYKQIKLGKEELSTSPSSSDFSDGSAATSSALQLSPM